jgi:hypothetical protein
VIAPSSTNCKTSAPEINLPIEYLFYLQVCAISYPIQLPDEILDQQHELNPCTGLTTQPTLKALVKIANALYISLDDLVFGENQRGPGDDLKVAI